MSGSLSRNKDGVPSWGGEPSTWEEYRAAARLYVASTKKELRYTCGPRLAAELSGAARTAIQGQRSTWLSEANGAEKLLKHLQGAIAEPALPEVGNVMRQYFRVLKRKKGESMTAFCVRHREEYDRMCRALGRMLREQGMKTKSSPWTAAAKMGASSGAPSDSSSSNQEQPPEAGANDTESQPAPNEEGTSTTAESWQRQWSWGTSPWSWWNQGYGGWYRANWSSEDWSGRGAWNSIPEEDEEEEDMVQVLPDAVQGWMLLDKCGLDRLERSVIQGDLKSNFTLAGVENSLRSHWTDDQIRRRDGEVRHQANFQDEDDDILEPEADYDESYFEDWSQQDYTFYQDARNQEHEAWLQLQQARRTLKDARARQHEVKMGRRFFRPSWQKGGGKGRAPVGAPPHQGPCMKCGKAHRTSDCPQKERDQERTLEAEELAEFTYFNDPMDVCVASDQDDGNNTDDHNQRPANEQHLDDKLVEASYTAWASSRVTTEEAIRQGKAVLDPGATKTMGSVHAVESFINRFGAERLERLDVTDRPTFGFGNSGRSRSLSTAYMEVPCSAHKMKMKIHVIGEGTAPILVSIDSLRKMGAIVDFRNDTAIFTALCASTLVSLERSQSGHQLFPLGEDPLKNGVKLPRPVHSLSALGLE